MRSQKSQALWGESPVLVSDMPTRTFPITHKITEVTLALLMKCFVCSCFRKIHDFTTIKTFENKHSCLREALIKI